MVDLNEGISGNIKQKKIGNLKEFSELISTLNHAVACKSISKEFAEQIIKLVADTLFKGKYKYEVRNTILK